MNDPPDPTAAEHAGDRGVDPLIDAARVLDELGAVVLDPEIHTAMTAVCAATNRRFAAQSTSIAILGDDGLSYVAAEGTGSEGIVGVRLGLSSGIAGFVASSGQSLIVADVQADPRFAVDVAERVGYIPTTLMAVPIADDRSVLGVLSILDPGRAGAESLDTAASLAHIAAPLITATTAARSLAVMVLDAVANVGADELADVLSATAAGSSGPSADLAELAALYAKLGRLSPADRGAATRIVSAFVDHATAPRRGRPRR
jgi:GAF domain-containing protein